MKLKTNGAAVQIVGVPVLTGDGCTVTVAEAVEVGAEIVLEADDGALLRAYTVADYLRCVVDGCTVRLTNTPEPPPVPPPEQVEPEPTPVEILQEEVKLLKAQNAALSDQNDFQEELIVELANTVYA